MANVNRPLLTLCAADLMCTEVLMIPREMSLQGAARMLARADVSGAPVVDTEGRCIGMVSATEFLHWVEHGAAEPGSKEPICAWQIPDEQADCTCRVEDHMTRPPVIASPGTRVTELARRMLDHHAQRAVVVDVSGRPIGIVSSTDILAAVACADPVDDQAGAEESVLSAAEIF
jgi:CBS domain-containing protein